jgi:lipid-binding SYLF domain-containing protein
MQGDEMINKTHKHSLLMKTAASISLASLLLATGCTTTLPEGAGTGSVKHGDRAEAKMRRVDIDTNANVALSRLYEAAKGSRELVEKAHGVLVFPSVLAAGLWVGGQYGEGVLRTGNKLSKETEDYYSILSASIGLQIGAQSKAIFLLFMTPESLQKFRQSKGWTVGGDASVAVLKVGANGHIDTRTAEQPVVAFVLTNSGLMANLALEGTKISKLK